MVAVIGNKLFQAFLPVVMKIFLYRKLVCIPNQTMFSWIIIVLSSFFPLDAIFSAKSKMYENIENESKKLNISL